MKAGRARLSWSCGSSCTITPYQTYLKMTIHEALRDAEKKRNSDAA